MAYAAINGVRGVALLIGMWHRIWRQTFLKKNTVFYVFSDNFKIIHIIVVEDIFAWKVFFVALLAQRRNRNEIFSFTNCFLKSGSIVKNCLILTLKILRFSYFGVVLALEYGSGNWIFHMPAFIGEKEHISEKSSQLFLLVGEIESKAHSITSVKILVFFRENLAGKQLRQIIASVGICSDAIFGQNFLNTWAHEVCGRKIYWKKIVCFFALRSETTQSLPFSHTDCSALVQIPLSIDCWPLT